MEWVLDRTTDGPISFPVEFQNIRPLSSPICPHYPIVTASGRPLNTRITRDNPKLILWYHFQLSSLIGPDNRSYIVHYIGAFIVRMISDDTCCYTYDSAWENISKI